MEVWCLLLSYSTILGFRVVLRSTVWHSDGAAEFGTSRDAGSDGGVGIECTARKPVRCA